ncbi:HNH endonuclease signature motif containing protein [Terriglobus aquaticus]|uniref:HNH endonuclease signature motif containing protein n=2 Tax=Terriglobus aquaticus TaxID=940139 RepID=A0ABW9KI23_9BACT
MGKRVAGRRADSAKLAFAGACLPFTQQQFSTWLLSRLGSLERVVQCAYCNCFLNVSTFVVDHRIPFGWPWFGPLGLHNLALSCASCNQRKGCMSDAGFLRLVHWASRSLDSRDLGDMLKRLGSGGMASRLLAESRVQTVVSKPNARPPGNQKHFDEFLAA